MGNNYQLLDRFKEMECSIFSYPLDNEVVDTNYISKSFYYEMDENFLYLKDASDNRIKTCIRISEIADIYNQDENVYNDLIRIKTYYHTTYYIHTNEKTPVPEYCDKCGHVFDKDDQVWVINQKGQYGSVFDGDWICKRLCDDCVSGFVG
jgi:predicted Zn-ribbon and HTH transcriptional regulator